MESILAKKSNLFGNYYRMFDEYARMLATISGGHPIPRLWTCFPGKPLALNYCADAIHFRVWPDLTGFLVIVFAWFH
jgi:hypothetical protein